MAWGDPIVSCGGCGRQDYAETMLQHGNGAYSCNGGPCWNAVEREREGNLDKDGA